jgi:4'-phosphopantetheinyl transferase
MLYEDREDVIAALQAYQELFPPEIRRRWGAYLSSPDKRRSIASKALLYAALMQEFPGAIPGQYPLRYDAKGRPFITSTEHFDFNISHSRNFIVCALSFEGAVGIDVHHRNERRKLDRFRRSLDRVIDLGRPIELEDWVELEAILKCTGEGLGGLRRVMDQYDRFTIEPFDLHPDYLCRVASLESLNMQPHSFQMPNLISAIRQQLEKSQSHVLNQ